MPWHEIAGGRVRHEPPPLLATIKRSQDSGFIPNRRAPCLDGGSGRFRLRSQLGVLVSRINFAYDCICDLCEIDVGEFSVLANKTAPNYQNHIQDDDYVKVFIN